MNTNDLNTALYEKMAAEQDKYRDWLKSQPPEEILHHTYEYTEEVESALNAYRDSLVNDTMQYPMNLGKIQASRVERIGDYVCFVQLGADTSSVEEQGDEAVITYCQEQNELALEAIRQTLE